MKVKHKKTNINIKRIPFERSTNIDSSSSSVSTTTTNDLIDPRLTLPQMHTHSIPTSSSSSNFIFHSCLLMSLVLLVGLSIGGTLAMFKILDSLVPMAKSLHTMATQGQQVLQFMQPLLPAWQEHIDENLKWVKQVRGSVDVEQVQMQMIKMQHLLNSTQNILQEHVEPNLAQWTKDVDHVLAMSSQLKMKDIHMIQKSIEQANEMLQYLLKNADMVPVGETMSSFTKLIHMVQETQDSWQQQGGFSLNLALQKPIQSVLLPSPSPPSSSSSQSNNKNKNNNNIIEISKKTERKNIRG
jgi:hypothetical protein